MFKLSPQAQAVLDAANSANSYSSDDCLNESRLIAAAALQAAVDQVVPDVPFDRRCITRELWDERDNIRYEFLAIVTELEAQP